MLLKGNADLYQADLVNLSGIANYDSDDVHRRLYQASLGDSLRSITGKEVTAAFKKILASSDRRPRMLQIDKGTEFLNATF